jgi:hypothetical protein
MRKTRTLVAVFSIFAAMGAAPAFAEEDGGGTPPAAKCNSGRGNLSEGSSAQLINPHTGGSGPGVFATVDCDPGNSGAKNRGGD